MGVFVFSQEHPVHFFKMRRNYFERGCCQSPRKAQKRARSL